MSDLLLGKAQDGADLFLPASALLRHVVALGSSGSGKTVFCKALVEECIVRGIPVIAVDPQGDLTSLAMVSPDFELIGKPVPLQLQMAYRDKAEVVVWTPGSALGVPLCVNPMATMRGAGEEAARDQAFAAESLADLLGFSPHAKEGRYVTAILSMAFEHAAQARQDLSGIEDLLKLLTAMPKTLADKAASLMDDKLLEDLVRRLRALLMGSSGRMFQAGAPLSINTLLGLGPDGAASGKTRLSVIYLNTLATDQEKQFFVAQLAQALYRWMLEHPSPTLQAMLYIDEISPYLPPVREPVCKDALKMLFRQARKYGISCLAATQNPGDLDYKALAQISTWALGRMMTQQDIKKVEGALSALDPATAESICQRMPKLAPGQFILLSPDTFAKPVDLQVRWLVTRHQTLNEQQIATATLPELRHRLEEKIGLEEEAGVATAIAPADSGSSLSVGRVEVKILSVDGNEAGSVNPCEIVLTRGTGKLTALGGQSKVTKESIKVAWSAAAQLQASLDLPLNLAKRYDVTVLDTRLSVKKDGPSAGLAYLAGIVAAFTGKQPRPDLAMTGEITILGNVLAVGGIKEKLAAAYHAGYATVLIPAENGGELEDLPAELRNALEIIEVSTVQEALPVLFAAAKMPSLQPRKPQTPALRTEKDALKENPQPTPQAETLEDRIAGLLDKESKAMGIAEMAALISISESSLGAALNRLVDAGTVKKAKDGRRFVYYSANLALRPEYGLLGLVEAVRLKVLAPQARKIVESTLASSFLVFTKEEISSLLLQYLPLYRVRFVSRQKEGWLFKKEVERRDNLYLNAVSGEVLSHHKGKGFSFQATLPENPIDVVDLDDLGCLEDQQPGLLEFAPSEIEGRLEEKAIHGILGKLFELEILETSLVFMPVWRAVVKDKQNSSERDVLLDGYEGKSLSWKRVASKKR